MGKVKSWAWDCAEEQVDDIIKSVKNGTMTTEEAEIQISKVQNVELLGIDEHNVGDFIYYETKAA